VTDQAIALLAPGIGTRAACAASGVPQATWYRRHRISPPAPKPAPVPHAGRIQPRALAAAGRAAILDALHSDRFADLAAPAQETIRYPGRDAVNSDANPRF
jgi:putative transposase